MCTGVNAKQRPSKQRYAKQGWPNSSENGEKTVADYLARILSETIRISLT
jgi:hypothetical protein